MYGVDRQELFKMVKKEKMKCVLLLLVCGLPNTWWSRGTVEGGPGVFLGVSFVIFSLSRGS